VSVAEKQAEVGLRKRRDLPRMSLESFAVCELLESCVLRFPEPPKRPSNQHTP